MRTLLLDADTLVYQAAIAAEKPIDWGAGLWTLHSDFEECREQVTETIAHLVSELSADRLICALTDSENWRKDVMPSYKNHRKTTRKPVCFKAVREFIQEKYECFLRPGLEGDDVLGILATHPTLVAGEKIILSIDKDLKTIPGYYLNHGKAAEAIAEDPSKSLEDFIVEVSEDEADWWHMYQTLTGDSTDGYPGCPGVGPVGAAKLLGECGEAIDVGEVWRDVVLPAYAKKGLGEEVALQNARVARILRVEDFDFKLKQVKLWNPPSI